MLHNGSEQLAHEMYLDDENSYAEWVMNGMEDTVEVTVGAGAMVGGAAYRGGKKAGQTMLDAGYDYNDWAQGLSDPDTGVYPYTRDDEIFEE
jgi:hypothetical protein